MGGSDESTSEQCQGDGGNLAPLAGASLLAGHFGLRLSLFSDFSLSL